MDEARIGSTLGQSRVDGLICAPRSLIELPRVAGRRSRHRSERLDQASRLRARSNWILETQYPCQLKRERQARVKTGLSALGQMKRP